MISYENHHTHCVPSIIGAEKLLGHQLPWLAWKFRALKSAAACVISANMIMIEVSLTQYHCGVWFQTLPHVFGMSILSLLLDDGRING